MSTSPPNFILTICFLIFISFIVSILIYAYYRRARKLTGETKTIIKTKGIVHYTSESNAKSIFNDKNILSGRTPMNARKVSYFFINEKIPYDILFYNLHHKNKPKNWKIEITNINESQIDLLKYRKFDSAIICKSNFKILSQNTTKITECEILDFKKTSKNLYKAELMFYISLWNLLIFISIFVIAWLVQ